MYSRRPREDHDSKQSNKSDKFPKTTRKEIHDSKQTKKSDSLPRTTAYHPRRAHFKIAKGAASAHSVASSTNAKTTTSNTKPKTSNVKRTLRPRASSLNFFAASRSAPPAESPLYTLRKVEPKLDQAQAISSDSKSKTHAAKRVSEKVQRCSKQNKLAHQLRLAVIEGKSTNPKTNRQLKNVIRLAIDEDMQINQIEQIIRKTEDIDKEVHMHLVQMRYDTKVFIICAVHTTSLVDLKAKMAPILKQHNAGFVSAIHKFYNCGIIEALISPKTQVNFNKLDDAIQRDAAACRANSAEIIDYETGACHFKCNPLEMSEVRRALIIKGYKVLHTEYGLRPKELVDLTFQELDNYAQFLRKIQKLPDVVTIYDNVKKKEIDSEDEDYIDFKNKIDLGNAAIEK